MIVFPNCKINLGLRIIRKRDDGFHDLETFFYPIPLLDALEVISTSRGKSPHNPISFYTTGLQIEDNHQDNLCIRAFNLLKEKFRDLPRIKMHLHKAIPIGAGLGGGSSDGAFTLKLLNEKLQLGLSTEELLAYSLQLGSDCPFFIINTPSLATGRGEFLEPIQVDLSPYSLIIADPGIKISTAWAFKQIELSLTSKTTEASTSKSIRQIIQQPETWKDDLKNDFEDPVITVYPQLQLIKQKFYETGAVYASLSGSGSCLYAIYPKHQLPSLSFEIPVKLYTIP